jgi:hypothetical protein
MLDQASIYYRVKTRISNNNVENWFNILKNHILNKDTNVIF